MAYKLAITHGNDMGYLTMMGLRSSLVDLEKIWLPRCQKQGCHRNPPVSTVELTGGH